MNIHKKISPKGQAQHTNSPSVSQRGISKQENLRSQWKENLKKFIQVHFLLLLKLAIVLLLGIVTLLLLFGKLKPINPAQQETSAEISNKQNSLALIKELNEKKNLPSLTIKREIVVSQFKLQDSQKIPASIHIQYPGSITFGIDLRKLKKDWLQFSEDTLILHMPPIEILTPIHQYVDNSQKKILIQTGEWSKQELESLFERANYKMKRQSIAEDSCFAIAEENARKLLLNIIHSHGYKYGTVFFAKNDLPQPITAKYPAGVIPNDYNFYTTATGQKMIFYKNGSIIHYNDNIPLEQLYNLAEFCATSFMHPVEITLQPEKEKYTLFISNTNADITTKETQSYRDFVKTNKEIKENLKKMIQTISQKLFKGKPCNIIETDKNNKIVIDYSKL